MYQSSANADINSDISSGALLLLDRPAYPYKLKQQAVIQRQTRYATRHEQSVLMVLFISKIS